MTKREQLAREHAQPPGNVVVEGRRVEVLRRVERAHLRAPTLEDQVVVVEQGGAELVQILHGRAPRERSFDRTPLRAQGTLPVELFTKNRKRAAAIAHGSPFLLL